MLKRIVFAYVLAESYGRTGYLGILLLMELLFAVVRYKL